MNYDEWNEICFLLSENIKIDISENSFELNVIQALRVLGWKQFSGDFDIRPSYQIGAANRITPDFVVKSSDNYKLFVIEIKQPNIPLTSTFQQQLFSYMRQLKLEYGILIGQGIQIFYDGNLTEQEDPILLETIRFEKNSEKGGKFAELFSKENFNPELLKEFTLSVLEKLNRKEEQKKLKSKILSDNYKDTLNGLIKQNFINEYDGELIDTVLTELRIEIIEKNIPLINSNIQIKQYSQPKIKTIQKGNIVIPNNTQNVTSLTTTNVFDRIYKTICEDLKAGSINTVGSTPIIIDNEKIRFGNDKRTESRKNMALLFDYFIQKNKTQVSRDREDWFRLINELTKGKTKTIDYTYYADFLQEMLNRYYKFYQTKI